MSICCISKARTFSFLWLAAAAAAVLWAASGCSDGPLDGAETSNDREPLLIKPGEGVGRIKEGMTVTDVTREIGEPQRRTSNALEYTKYGFAVMPDAEGFVRVVMCGDVTGLGGPLVSRFKAKTAAGIGMGSTQEEVIRAYGQPTIEETHPGGRHSLDYRNLGLTFSIESGKVHHIIVRFGEEFQNAPAIGVETKP